VAVRVGLGSKVFVGSGFVGMTSVLMRVAVDNISGASVLTAVGASAGVGENRLQARSKMGITRIKIESLFFKIPSTSK